MPFIILSTSSPSTARNTFKPYLNNARVKFFYILLYTAILDLAFTYFNRLLTNKRLLIFPLKLQVDAYKANASALN